MRMLHKNCYTLSIQFVIIGFFTKLFKTNNINVIGAMLADGHTD